MAHLDIFHGQKAMVFFSSTLMSTLIQRIHTIHHSYIAKGAGMRTLKRYYHIGTIPADYDQKTYSAQSSW